MQPCELRKARSIWLMSIHGSARITLHAVRRQMAKLKLSAIREDSPVKLTIELPVAVHRDLVVYARPRIV